MKLSISTLGCPGWDLDQVVNYWSDLGVEGIEVRGIGGVMMADEIVDFSSEQRTATLEKVTSKGLKLIGFGTSSSFHDVAKHEKSIGEAKRAIDVCQRMGIPFIRVFGNNVSAENEQESLQNIVTGLSQVCEYAEGTGVNVYLEIHGEINTAERLRYLTERLVKYSSFGILWDICHTYTACGNDIDEVYSVIRPFVRHVHLKDRHGSGKDYSLCTIGEGDIDIADIIKRLQKDGYTGYYSLEHEKKWHPELPEAEVEFPRYVAYMKQLIEKLS